MSQRTDWDLVIRPHAGWFDLHVGDVWQYRDLTLLFAWRDLASQYKQTLFGPAWHLLQPLLTTLLFATVFGRVAGLSTDGRPPLLFYMTGVTCWTLFADSFTRTSATFIQNSTVFGKVYFPRLTVPLSAILSTLVKFGIQMCLLLAFVAFYLLTGRRWHVDATILLIPLLIAMTSAFALGLGLIVSALTVKYRDLQVVAGFGVQLAMFATPVILPMSSLHGIGRWILLLNPLASIIEAFRHALIGNGMLSPAYLSFDAVAILVVLICGVLLFNRAERTFVDVI